MQWNYYRKASLERVQTQRGLEQRKAHDKVGGIDALSGTARAYSTAAENTFYKYTPNIDPQQFESQIIN
jgi:hypothetical protein